MFTKLGGYPRLEIEHREEGQTHNRLRVVDGEQTKIVEFSVDLRIVPIPVGTQPYQVDDRRYATFLEMVAAEFPEEVRTPEMRRQQLIEAVQKLLQAIPEMSDEAISYVHPFFCYNYGDDLEATAVIKELEKTVSLSEGPLEITTCDYCGTKVPHCVASDSSLAKMTWEFYYYLRNPETGEPDNYISRPVCHSCGAKHGEELDEIPEDFDSFIMKYPPEQIPKDMT